MTRRRVVVVLVVIAALVALAAVLVARGDDTHGVTGARAVVADRARFRESERAARSFAHIADELLRAGRGCSKEEEACRRTLAAAAFAHVVASVAIGCTAADIEPARAGLERYLARLSSAQPEETPPVPTCT